MRGEEWGIHRTGNLSRLEGFYWRAYFYINDRKAYLVLYN